MEVQDLQADLNDIQELKMKIELIEILKYTKMIE